MRNTSSSKLLGSTSAGKQSHAKHQKELRQAQRQQQNQYMSLQDTDLAYSAVQAPRTVKNSTRTSYSTSDAGNNNNLIQQPAGPSSSSGSLGQSQQQTKSSLHVARAKLLNHHHSGPQQSNLFGGLSRHVINASSSATMPASKTHQSNTLSNVQQHSRQNSGRFTNEGKQQVAAMGGSQGNLLQRQQYSQHNANYHQTVPTSPTGIVMHASLMPQQCNRTLAALENMNQTQQKMRKSESQTAHKQSSNVQQQHQVQGLYPTAQNSANLPNTHTPKTGHARQMSYQSQSNGALKQQFQPSGEPGKMTPQGQQKQTKYIKQKASQQQQQPQQQFEENEFEQRSISALEGMQPQPSPVPHSQFLGQRSATVSENLLGPHDFSKRASLLNKQVQQEQQMIQGLGDVSHRQVNKRKSHLDSQDHSLLGTGHFVKESTLLEIDCNPELTSPLMSKEDQVVVVSAAGDRTAKKQITFRPSTSEAGVMAHLCCHEKVKENAVLTQKVNFMSQQISEEKESFKMKEANFNKMIAALKKTAEENAAKKSKADAQTTQQNSSSLNPSQKDWKDTLDELNKKKEQVNSLEEQVLKLELKAEKVALDHKLALQQKDDEIGEERLKVRHKESDLRQANAQLERLNEDIQSRIQEALDRQSDRLGNEKQSDMDAMNKRNEQLIKQLVESHSAETRHLRELLLEQERKAREAESEKQIIECELRNAKLEHDNKFDSAELEEIQMQNNHVNEVRFNNMKSQLTEENQQMRDVILQLENHINQLQENKSEADRKLIISEDKIQEIKKEVAKNKILVASQKDKEEKLQMTFKAQIAKERKTADMAVTKMKGVQKLEADLNKKQILINQLRGRILEMEREEMHKGKILLQKRRQIEDEKTVLIKKQALRQRSMTRTNISATRLQQQLETKQAVIQTERESKKALQEEKHKLEKEIASIKREKTVVAGGESSRHNESMSMYFARSQGLFSPRNRGDVTNKSMIANGLKGSKTTRHAAVFMSQQQLDRKELYLSKQFSNDKTSSMGGGSLQGGDSMVNIVEFEENASPQSRGRRVEGNNSILSTPFKNDEPNESKITNLNFRTKAAFSQSMLAQHPESKTFTDGKFAEDSMNHIAIPIVGSGQAQFQTHTMIKDDRMKHFKTGEGQKIGKIADTEAEFIQVLSGCDSDNNDESNGNIKMLPNMRSHDKKTPGMQMSRKPIRPANATKSKDRRHSKELKEIKLIGNASNGSEAAKNQGRASARNRMGQSHSFISKGAAQMQLNSKQSPHKAHHNMASMLTEQRMLDSKESFVRTVLTARQECEQFNNTIRQKEEHALTARQKSTSFKGTNPVGIGDSIVNAAQTAMNQSVRDGQVYIQDFDDKAMVEQTQFQVAAGQPRSPMGAHGPQPHDKIRHLNRVKTQPQFLSNVDSSNRKYSSVQKPFDNSEAVREMAAEKDVGEIQRKIVTDQTPESPTEKIQRNSELPLINDSFNVLNLKQFVNVTSSIGDESEPIQDISSHSNRLIEENQALKDQLQMVHQNLMAHQQKAATTEVTMMDAIMQMKEQIQQVMQVGGPAGMTGGHHQHPQQQQQPKHHNRQKMLQIGTQDEDRARTRTHHKLDSNPFGSVMTNKHEDYMVMSRISRNSFEEDPTLHTKTKKVKTKLPNNTTNDTKSDQQSIRKTNSVHLRQRSETFDLTQAQAESMYKKIKIKSPNKRASNNQNTLQGSGGSGLQPSASFGNFQKQTTSSAMKRTNMEKQQLQQQFSKHSSNVSSFNQQQMLQSQGALGGSNQPSSLRHSETVYSQSFYQSQKKSASKQNCLSMGVLKQSAQQNARKMTQAAKTGAGQQHHQSQHQFATLQQDTSQSLQ